MVILFIWAPPSTIDTRSSRDSVRVYVRVLVPPNLHIHTEQPYTVRLLMLVEHEQSSLKKYVYCNCNT